MGTSGCGGTLAAVVSQYTALSDGQKKQYTDSDGLPEYNSGPILSPDQVSYCNLYINSMLQPPINYHVTQGLLVLLTDDCPPSGAPVVLEYVTMFDSGCPLQAAVNYYVARAGLSQTSYTDSDALPALSTGGIPAAQSVTLQRLFVNGMLQPPGAYATQLGALTLHTIDAPQPGCFVILQSICVCVPTGHHRAASAVVAAVALQDCATARVLQAQVSLLQQGFISNRTPADQQRLHCSVVRLLAAATLLGQVQQGTLAELVPRRQFACPG